VSAPTVIVKSYSAGESGDQSRGSGMLSVRLSAGPVVAATCLPSRLAETVACGVVVAEVSRRSTTLPEIAGVIWAEVT